MHIAKAKVLMANYIKYYFLLRILYSRLNSISFQTHAVLLDHQQIVLIQHLKYGVMAE